MDIFGLKEILFVIACSQSLYFLFKVRRARVIETDFENKEKKNKTTSFFFLLGLRARRIKKRLSTGYSCHCNYFLTFIKFSLKNKKATCKDSQGRLIGVATVPQERFSFKD